MSVTFNISVRIWHNKQPTLAVGMLGPPDVTSVAAIGANNRNWGSSVIVFGAVINGPGRPIMLPKDTDVRDLRSQTGYDIIGLESPQKGFYVVYGVYDVSVGYGGEFRVAFSYPCKNSDWPGAWSHPY